MFTESKVTEIYCMADDFCKEFAVQQENPLFFKHKIGTFNEYLFLRWIHRLYFTILSDRKVN